MLVEGGAEVPVFALLVEPACCLLVGGEEESGGVECLLMDWGKSLFWSLLVQRTRDV